MLPSRSRILSETINPMEMQWDTYDQVVCRSSDAVIISRAVISQHTKVKNFSWTSASPNKTLLHTTTTTPQQLKLSILDR